MDIILITFWMCQSLSTTGSITQISYQQDIKITENEIKLPPGKKNEGNMLSWKTNLIPEIKETIRMDYQVEYPEGKSVSGLD